jgi:hypothetical protein
MSDIVHGQVHDRQLAVLHEIGLLNAPRPGFLEMEVDVRLPFLSLPPRYVKQDICSLIDTHKHTQALIYFDPKYTLDKTGRQSLYADLLRAALLGGDRIMLWGTVSKATNQSMYIRCQCAAIYRGEKVNSVTGDIIEREDYRTTTYCNDRKNQRNGQKGRNASHRTAIDRRLTKDDDRCPFRFSVFQDNTGYFIKSKLGTKCHQFHPRRDHLRTSTSLLGVDDSQLQADLNSARAKVGTAANLHFVRTTRQGTPTVLSRNQIRHVVKKNPVAGGDSGGAKENGEIDDIYQFLEATGNSYVSLLARGPSCGPDLSTDPSGILFNETRTGGLTAPHGEAAFLFQ